MASQVMAPTPPLPTHHDQSQAAYNASVNLKQASSQTTPAEIPLLSLVHSQLSSHTAKRVHREVRFGAYVLGSTLGEGEFGKVKLGWRKDGKHPSQVAIKLIKRDSILKDLELEVKIHREINSLKMLNHPNIVNLVEVMKSGKYIGIVLEYASGGELFDYILHHKYLKENTAKKLFAQLISGVDYMHSKGLIHRDLKLENLLLDKHKNIIISDFGFVNSYNREKNDFMKTSCGSPCYAAPELVLTQTPYEGRKVDIWSLGVILYAMLAGYLPFDDDPENEDGSDIIRLYHYICKTPLTFPEYVSPLARDLLRKIIVPDPKKRININDIRHHPWLAPHAPFLAVRQPDWDRIHKEKSVVGHQPAPQVQNKRFSMVNERTNSSSLMMQDLKPFVSYGPSSGNANSSTSHTRSYSSTSISQLYSSPSISSSLANVVAKQDRKSPDAQAESGTDSATPSPTKTPYARGHTKSASASYTLASTALKAVVEDSAKRTLTEAKRNLVGSIEFPSGTKSYNFPTAPLPRSTTYTGTAISTIVELPTRSSVQQIPPLSRPYVSGANAPRESSRLPHSTKKPRPTSYHPLSMTSLLMSSGGSPPSLLEYIKIPSPVNAPIPQFMSTSPTKALPVSDTTEENVRMSPIVNHASRRNSVVTHVHVNGVLSNDSKSSAHPSPEQRGSLVLSYLEDKMDALELAESPTKSLMKSSPTSSATAVSTSMTPQINHLPAFDVQTRTLPQESVQRRPSRELTPEVSNNRLSRPDLTPEISSTNTFSDSPISQGIVEPVVIAEAPSRKPVVTTVQALVPPPPSDQEAKPKKKKEEPLVAKARTKEKKAEKVKRSSSVYSRKDLVPSKENKENVIAKEQKKRNRFSLLSLYSSYNSNAETPSSLTASVVSSRKALEDITVALPQNSNLHYKHTSASSSSASVPTLNSQQFTAGSGSIGTAAASIPGTAISNKDKRVHSSSSSNSKKSASSGATSSSASGKEASAARKVMDFFKRRSVRLG